MPPDSAVRKSRQGWKISAWVVGTFAGGFLLFVMGVHREDMATAISGIALGFGTFLAACLSIRCPRCGARWLWTAMRTQHHVGWWNWLCAQKVCPKCAYDPGTGLYASRSPDTLATSGEDTWHIGKLILTTIGLSVAGIATAIMTFEVLQSLKVVDDEQISRTALPLALFGPTILFTWWRARKRKERNSEANDSASSARSPPSVRPPTQ